MQEKDEQLILPPLLERLRPLLTQRDVPVYLVGGAVRDALLGRISLDLDFVVPDQAIALAFVVADALGVPAFIMDEERDIARVVIAEDTFLDFARFRGPDLEADLRARDFTINAMALPVSARTADPARIIDPCEGRQDLKDSLIRLTNNEAIRDDPVRALRAIRLAASLGMQLTEKTARMVQGEAWRLNSVSAERIRDEIIKSLQNPAPDRALSLMAELELLSVIMPEVAALRNVEQSAPHHEPALAHTISVLRWLVLVENGVLAGEDVDDEAIAQARQKLALYAERLAAHLGRGVDGGLNGSIVLRLGALFHDVGKAETATVEPGGRIRFFGHDRTGAALAVQRLRQLRLSNEAIKHIRRLVEGHMRPLSLNQAEKVTRRAIFRFFRSTGTAGLDIALLTIADHLATHRGAGSAREWEGLLSVVERLCEAYFEGYEKVISPPALIGGGELMAALNLKPGPEVGRLLRLIEEAQAAGEVTNQEEALALARKKVQ